MLGLQHRLQQLNENVSMLEKEDNGNLYGAVSLRIIQLELAEIQDLLDKLSRTNSNNQQLSTETADQVNAHKHNISISFLQFVTYFSR